MILRKTSRIIKRPTFDLLDKRENSEVEINNGRTVCTNKKLITETLKNYNIEISSITATVGPTVTLYEIKPAPGVRIARIKSLENDIALSLSALGIRIIAPIPGKEPSVSKYRTKILKWSLCILF